MDFPIIVSKVEQTCFACPSQWEGTTDDGKYVYVRYRWGYLSIEVDNKPLLSRQMGGGFDGQLSFDELVMETQGIIEWR